VESACRKKIIAVNVLFFLYFLIFNSFFCSTLFPFFCFVLIACSFVVKHTYKHTHTHTYIVYICTGNSRFSAGFLAGRFSLALAVTNHLNEMKNIYMNRKKKKIEIRKKKSTNKLKCLVLLCLKRS
jgi:hypothetical protein